MSILRRIYSIDFLFIILLWSIFIDRIFNTEILYKVVLIYSAIIMFFEYIRKPFFSFNIYILFVLFILIRQILNIPSFTLEQSLKSFTPTIQIIIILLFVPFLIKVYSYNIYKIKELLEQFNIYVFINNLIVFLTLFDIFVLPIKNYEIYGSRHFGVLSDQLPWITSFFFLYSFHNKKYFYFFFYTISLLISGSLNAIIIAFVSFIIYLIKLKKIKLTYIFLFLSVILITVFTKNALIERLNQKKYEGSVNLRILAFQNGVETFKENMIIGNGYGTYDFVNKFTKENLLPKNSPLSSDTFNQFLQILCDLGIIGFILYFLIILSIYNLKVKKYTYIKIWVLSLMLLSISSVWLRAGSVVYILFILLLSIIIFEDKVNRHKRNENV